MYLNTIIFYSKSYSTYDYEKLELMSFNYINLF